MTALSQELSALQHGGVPTAPQGLAAWVEGAKCLSEMQAQVGVWPLPHKRVGVGTTPARHVGVKCECIVVVQEDRPGVQ